MKVNRHFIFIGLLLTGLLGAYNELTDIYFEEQPGFAEIMLKFREEVVDYRNYLEKKNIVLFFPYMDYFKDLNKIDVNKANVKYIKISPGKNHTVKIIIAEKERSEYKVEQVGNIVTVRVYPPKLMGKKAVQESVATLPQLHPSTIMQILNIKRVKFHPPGRRDIFKSLVAERPDSLLLDPFSAKLVGVIIQGRKKLGIFVDKSNKTYILKEGTMVKNGKLWKLTENQAIFLVGLRGYARTIRIKLKNPMEILK